MNDIDDLVEDVQEVAESVMQLGMKKTLGFAGILSGVFGFVADVLQPIAPFAIYLLIASTLLLLVSLVWYVKAKKGLVLGIVSLCTTVVLGIVTILQQATDAEDGFVAEVVPGVSDFQKSLGLVEEKLDAIKEDTAAIKSDTQAIKESTAKVVENTEDINSHTKEIAKDTATLKTDTKEVLRHSQKVADNTAELVEQGKKTQESIEKIGVAVEAVANNGGIKKAPKSAEDHYHNAKLYELNGDYGNAKRSYQAYFKYKTEKLDPHLRLTDFLRVNEGRNGAREMYGLIIKGSESHLSAFVNIILHPSRELRIQKLTEFNAQHPEFAPAIYYLSKEFSLDRLGKQSFSDKRNEYKYLTAFKQSDDTGTLVKYFIDKELLGTWQQDVRSRLKAAEGYVQQLSNPVTVTWTAHNAGFNGFINILEPATKIEYRESGKGEFKDNGTLTHIHPATGKPIPNPTIALPKDQGVTEFEVKYTNASGQISDTYIIKLEEKHVKGSQIKDGKVEIDKNAYNMVMMTKTSWISFREWNGKTMVYFTGILGHRGILKKITYGINKETPDQDWQFKPYNKAGFAPIAPNMKMMTSVPKDTKFVSVELTFKDDTKSEVVKFNNPAAK